LSYEEKLKMCRYLTTLQRRRSRGEFIEAYKIITEKKAELQWEKFFELAPRKALTATCRARYKLFKKLKGALGQTFFSA